MKNGIRFVALISLVFALCFNMLAQKKVAVLDVKKMTSSVTAIQASIVRGGIEVAVANAPGYEGYDRTSFDAILSEHNFQRSGAVNANQIKQMGEMAGVQFVIVPEVTVEGSDMYILVKMLDVESGKFGAAQERLCKTTPSEIKQACADLGAKLLNVSAPKPTNNTYSTSTNNTTNTYNTTNTTNKTTLNFSTGTYTGEVLNGKRNGQGIMNYNSEASNNGCKSYEGSWKNGYRHGYGIMIWNNGAKYVGNWVNDKRSGQGTHYYSGGNKYEGNWADGKMNGPGTYYWTNGDTDTGTWVNDKKDGKFTRTTKTGKKLKAQYSNGEIINDWH